MLQDIKIKLKKFSVDTPQTFVDLYQKIKKSLRDAASLNTVYPPRLRLALWEIALFGGNFVYA